MRTVRAWAAVHNTVPAFGVMMLVALASLMFADTIIDGIGPFRFWMPVSTLLLLPAIAGVSAAVACASTHHLPLPNPARAHAARAGWAVAWTALAALAASLGLLFSSGTSSQAVTRNVAIYMTLSLVMVSIGQSHLAWAPVFAYTIAAMLFGHGSNSGQYTYYWWAVVMRNESTTKQLVTSLLVLSIGLTLYVFKPSQQSRC